MSGKSATAIPSERALLPAVASKGYLTYAGSHEPSPGRTFSDPSRLKTSSAHDPSDHGGSRVFEDGRPMPDALLLADTMPTKPLLKKPRPRLPPLKANRLFAPPTAVIACTCVNGYGPKHADRPRRRNAKIAKRIERRHPSKSWRASSMFPGTVDRAFFAELPFGIVEEKWFVCPTSFSGYIDPD